MKSIAAMSCTVMLALAVVGPGAAAAPGAEPETTVVIWGGEEHRTRASLEAWLRERGASYEVWAERHPAAAARLESAPGGAEPTPVVPEPGRGDAAAPAAEAKWTTLPGLLVLGVFALGIVLLLAGGLFASPLVFAVPGRRTARFLHSTSLELAGAGVVAVLAAAVAYTLAL